jgi:hypothetical protein
MKVFRLPGAPHLASEVWDGPPQPVILSEALERAVEGPRRPRHPLSRSNHSSNRTSACHSERSEESPHLLFVCHSAAQRRNLLLCGRSSFLMRPSSIRTAHSAQRRVPPYWTGPGATSAQGETRGNRTGLAAQSGPNCPIAPSCPKSGTSVATRSRLLSQS